MNALSSLDDELLSIPCLERSTIQHTSLLYASLQAKIETLESQVVKLTAQTRSLTAEKEDLGGRAAKLGDLLQARDRALVSMTSQLGQMRTGGGGAQGVLPPDTPQLTLTYCSPPLVLTNSQVSIGTVSPG